MPLPPSTGVRNRKTVKVTVVNSDKIGSLIFEPVQKASRKKLTDTSDLNNLELLFIAVTVVHTSLNLSILKMSSEKFRFFSSTVKDQKD